MSDDIISLDDFRKKRRSSEKNEDGDGDALSFHFSGDALDALYRLVERLEAPHNGGAIAIAIEILRLTLDEMDAGRRVVALDDNGAPHDFFVDPRSFFRNRKPPPE